MEATEPILPADAIAAAGGPRLLRALRWRDFRLVLGGETISLLGDQFHFIALAWLVLQLTGSGLALGTVLMAAAIPRAVLMLVGGHYSDRLSPRSLMLTSNALRAMVVGIVAAIVLSGNAQLWQLYILAAIFGVVDAFFYPAMNTILPMLVSDEDLPPANALLQGAQQLATLVGPAIAGFVVALLSTGPAFVVDAISFAVAATALLLVAGGRRARPEAGQEGPAVLQSIGSGIRYALDDPAIRALVVLTAAFNLGFTGPVNVGLAWLADNRFTGGASALGLLLSAFGAGALVGAVLAGSLRRIPHLGLVTMLIALGLGIGLAGLGLAPNTGVALAIGAPMGVGVGFINVRTIAWLQARVADEMRGRVMSLVMLGSVGLAPISLAAAGALIDFGAVTLMYAAAGALIAVAALAGVLWGVPRQMVDPE